jgi:hypothetical protein
MLSKEALHKLKVGFQEGTAKIRQQHRFVSYAVENAASTAERSHWRTN